MGFVSSSFSHLKKRPSVFAWSALFWAFLLALSYASSSIASFIQSNLYQALWLAFISLVILFSSGLYSWKIIKIQKSIPSGWLKGASIISLSLALIAGIYAFGLIFINKISIGIGNSLSLSLSAAQVLFFILYISLVFGIVFLSALPFISLIDGSWVFSSIKKSLNFAAKNYFQLLSIFIILYALSQTFSLALDPLIAGAINTIIGTPIFIVLITSLITNSK